MTVSRFAVTALLARRLSVEAFGQYAYSQWLVDIGFLVCTLGATGVASRYLAEYRLQPAILAGIVQRWRPFSFSLPFCGALAAGLGALFSGLSFNANTYGLLVCWGLASGMWGMHTAALAGLQRFDLIFIANAVAAAVMLLGAVIAPIEHGGPAVVFLFMAIAAGLASLIGLRPIAAVSRGIAGDINSTLRKGMYRYAFNIWLTALMWSLVWSRGEIPVLRGLQGDEAVATYTVALTLYGGAVAGVMLWVGGIAPQITRYLGDNDVDAAVALCRSSMDLQLLFSGIGALGLIWLAPELIYFGFGEQYGDSAGYLAVLALSLPAMALASHNHLLQIITDARFNRNTTILGVLILLGFALVGISMFGVVGAAFSRALTLVVMSAITFTICWRRWGGKALGRGNIGLVGIVSVVSAFCAMLPELHDLSVRVVILLATSLVLLAFIRAESKESVTILVGRRILLSISSKK